MSAHGRESCKQPLTPVLLLRTEIEERVFLLPKIKKKKKKIFWSVCNVFINKSPAPEALGQGSPI